MEGVFMNRRKNNQMLAEIVIALVVALFFSACTTFSPRGLDGLLAEENQKEHARMKKNNYLLGPDDVVRVVVEQHPEWSGEFVVSPEGKVVVPGLCEINAEGLDRELLKKEFAAHLENYIDNPKVTIDIARYASQVIYVLGEVSAPGKYPTEGKQVTLRDAIITAGLPKKFAATNRVFVITSSRRKPVRKVVNLYRILYRGELKNNIVLNPGDVVYVPQTLLGMASDLLTALLTPLSSVSAARTAVEP
jgi:polysaccharide export outer membrane protein